MQALVTGAAKRLGRTIALTLQGAGYRVAVHYRSSRADAEQTAALLGGAPLIQGDQAKDPERIVHEAACALAGLASLTRLLALEWAPEVRVNGVAPGAVLLPEGTDAASLAKRIPLGRIGTPEDAARAVLFLAREPFITGEILTVDGGRSLNP